MQIIVMGVGRRVQGKFLMITQPISPNILAGLFSCDVVTSQHSDLNTDRIYTSA